MEQEQSTGQSRRIACIVSMFLAITLYNACESMLGPVLPVQGREKGVSETWLGLILGSQGLVVFCTSPFTGALFAKFSLRAVSSVALILFGALFSLFGWVHFLPTVPSFIAVCGTIRTVAALTVSLLQASIFTAAIGLFPSRKTFIYGVLEAGVGLGSVLGPVVGTLLYAKLGFGAPYWILGSSVCLCGVVNSIVLPSISHGSDIQGDSSMYGSELLAMFRSPLVTIGSLTITLAGLLDLVYDPVYAARLKQLGAPFGIIGLLFALPNVGFAAFVPVFGILLDWRELTAVYATVSLLLYFVIMTLFGPAPFFTFLPRKVWLSGFSGFLSGVCLASIYSCGVNCLFQGAKKLSKGDDVSTDALVTGIAMSMLSLGNMIGPIMGGAVAEHAGFEWAMTWAGFLCLAVMCVFIGYMCATKSNCKVWPTECVSRATVCLYWYRSSRSTKEDEKQFILKQTRVDQEKTYKSVS